MGPALFSDTFYTKLLVDRQSGLRGYASVASSGSISIETRSKPSLLTRLSSYLTFSQNSDLAAVDTRLCQIFAAARTAESPELQELTAEARQHKHDGFLGSCANVRRLHKSMQKSNQKSWWQKTALTLVNLVRRCLGKDAIAFRHYRFADLEKSEIDSLQTSVEKSAFRPTEKEKAEVPFNLEVLSATGQDDKFKLKANTVTKMQLGFRNDFKYLVVGQNGFYLRYHKRENIFSLQLISANHNEDLALLENASKSRTFAYTVDVKFASLDPAKSDGVQKLVTKKVVTVNNSWFGYKKTLESQGSEIYQLPCDREIHIPVEGQKEPFRFIIRSNKLTGIGS